MRKRNTGDIVDPTVVPVWEIQEILCFQCRVESCFYQCCVSKYIVLES